MSNEITIRISRDQLLQLKQTDYAMYQFIISAKDKEGDYYETIDREKLKAECDLKYFNPDDLFSKQDLIDCCLKNGWLIELIRMEFTEFNCNLAHEQCRGKPQAFDGIQKLDEIEINKAQSLGVTEESLKKAIPTWREIATLAEDIKLDNKSGLNASNIADNTYKLLITFS